jgi:isoleucyl-tRNA synthetase
MYKAVPAQIDLPAMEHQILQLWDSESVFERSVSQAAGRPLWTFYEGPPTANGTPGAHHVEARVFKDIFPRYRTMKGYFVPRQAGWDCHGLPVELAVEREWGFNGKQDIEDYGIAEFNALRSGPTRPRSSRRPLLSTMRHRAQRSRIGARLRNRGRPLGVCPLPDHLR